MKRNIRDFLADESGPTAAEYAIMVALILVVLVTVVTTFGKTTSGTFSKSNSTLSAALGS